MRPAASYYHAFLPEQPDLNWRNPAVRAAMHDAMRFWLDKGVDGFRVDVMWHLIKDDQFRDNPENPGAGPGGAPAGRLIPEFSADRPEVHEVVAGLRAVMDAYPARVLIGEIWLPPERLVRYYGANLQGAHLPFNFQLIDAPWDARLIAGLIDRYEAALPPGGWPNWVLGNHDRSRIASRVGPRQARVAALLLLTLRGTPTLYYGDEIGMTDVPIPPERVRDPFEKNVPGLGLGRDPVRTPMPWDGSANAGFCPAGATPWLPLGADWAGRTVARQREEPDSLLQFYRRLIALRRMEPALSLGSYVAVPAEGPVLAYERHHGDRRLLVALNLGGAAGVLPLAVPGRVLLSSGGHAVGAALSGRLDLEPGEGVILALPPG